MSVQLETERLILRLPVEADLDDWAALDADPRAKQFLGGCKSRIDAWREMAAATGMWTLKGCGLFSVLEKHSGLWIGRVGPWIPEGMIGSEIGWAISPAYWGKGYATEAAHAALQWAFEDLGWTEVIHCIDAANTPSISIAHRLGSAWLREGRESNGDEVQIYGQTRQHWRFTHPRKH